MRRLHKLVRIVGLSEWSGEKITFCSVTGLVRDVASSQHLCSTYETFLIRFLYQESTLSILY